MLSNKLLEKYKIINYFQGRILTFFFVTWREEERKKRNKKGNYLENKVPLALSNIYT
jgi:hypothetical protein